MITLNFRQQYIRDMIISGRKTIETRALNPEEPEKYFGSIQIGDNILLCNKITKEELKAKVTNKRIWKNFDELRQNQEILSKVRPDEYYNFNRPNDLREWWDSLAPGT